MAAVWACADAMMLLHKDWKSNLQMCRKSVPGSIVLVLRVALIAFSASLSQWQKTTPESIALIGLAICSAQLVLRILTPALFPDERVNDIIQRESQAFQLRTPLSTTMMLWLSQLSKVVMMSRCSCLPLVRLTSHRKSLLVTEMNDKDDEHFGGQGTSNTDHRQLEGPSAFLCLD
jgi:hypothetical protein